MKPFASVVVAIFLSGCAAEPPPSLVAGRDASDPSAPVSAVRYRSVTAGTIDYRPVSPKPWGEQNSRATSKPMDGMKGMDMKGMDMKGMKHMEGM